MAVVVAAVVTLLVLREMVGVLFMVAAVAVAVAEIVEL
jgi:hypothetical protein